MSEFMMAIFVSVLVGFIFGTTHNADTFIPEDFNTTGYSVRYAETKNGWSMQVFKNTEPPQLILDQNIVRKK